MGHYYSEMYSSEEIDRERQMKMTSRLKTAEQIQKAIDEHGIAYVLADIILDDTSVGFKYKRY